MQWRYLPLETYPSLPTCDTAPNMVVRQRVCVCINGGEPQKLGESWSPTPWVCQTLTNTPACYHTRFVGRTVRVYGNPLEKNWLLAITLACHKPKLQGQVTKYKLNCALNDPYMTVSIDVSSGVFIKGR